MGQWGGGYPTRSSWWGVPWLGGYPGQGVPWPGGTLARQGVPWPGGVPCQVQLGGTLVGGTLARGVPWPGGYPGRGGTLARGGTQLGQHREYLLHGGRYASCVHAGGLSCFLSDDTCTTSSTSPTLFQLIYVCGTYFMNGLIQQTNIYPWVNANIFKRLCLL